AASSVVPPAEGVVDEPGTGALSCALPSVAQRAVANPSPAAPASTERRLIIPEPIMLTSFVLCEDIALFRRTPQRHPD
ncbi:MAG: hypothetical protein C4346_09550, partial [Chloroflexota bacterium]